MRRKRNGEWHPSPRQRQVLLLLLGGLGDKEIGHWLGISRYTARKYVDQIVGRLGAANRTHAVALALGAELVAPGEVAPARGAL